MRHVLDVDASGKATFTITASDPDTTDSNNADGTSDSSTHKIDRVRFTYTVALALGGQAVDDAISDTTAGAQTITFSDARGEAVAASVKTAAKHLAAPPSGSASNVAIVTVVDQYGKPVRGHEVVLTGSSGDSTFPTGDRRARRTDSSGTVRIGYTKTGGNVIETLTARTHDAAEATESNLTAIPGGTAMFYWTTAALASTSGTPTVASGDVHVADLDRNMLVVGAPPLTVVYDANDQFTVGGAASTMAAFEETLEADEANNDTIAVSSYDPTDPSDVAIFAFDRGG